MHLQTSRSTWTTSLPPSIGATLFWIRRCSRERSPLVSSWPPPGRSTRNSSPPRRTARRGSIRPYRQSIGVIQPIYHGGEAFAGYRIGRGDFEPWYQERQTNDGGEFKAGLAVPLARNRGDRCTTGCVVGDRPTDANWLSRTSGLSSSGSFRARATSSGTGVAASENLQIADRVLRLAEDRSERIRRPG